MKQSQTDLRRHLEEQVQFLGSSAAAYDAGNESEAKRLAVPLRVMLHDTRNSSSLLGQLDLKNRLNFLDTAIDRPKAEFLSHTALAAISFGAGPTGYVPHYDDHVRGRLPFEAWWKAPIIIDAKQREISRGRLVLSVADQDGGAHVDPELEEIYAELSRDNSLRRYGSTPSGMAPLEGAIAASLRQIAHELMRTLNVRGYAVAPPRSGGWQLGSLDLECATIPEAIAKGLIPKVGRNDPCPCRSGKKFKKCCGRPRPS